MQTSDESQELKEIWSQLEQDPNAGRLQPGLPLDDPDAEGFEYAFDNHYLPATYWSSLRIHNGEEPGEGPGVHPRVRLLSLRESIDFETVTMKMGPDEDFDEEDIAAGWPKAEAARRKLQRVNSRITVESVVADIHFANVEGLVEDVDVVVDATDNFETRYLLYGTWGGDG